MALVVSCGAVTLLYFIRETAKDKCKKAQLCPWTDDGYHQFCRTVVDSCIFIREMLCGSSEESQRRRRREKNARHDIREQIKGKLSNKS